MAEKPSKIGFNIKLSSETSEKLKQTELTLKQDVKVENVEILSKEPEAVPETDKEIKEVCCVDDKKGKVPENVAEEDEKHETSSSDEANNVSAIDYAQHVHYEGELAIYTDPATKQQYTWAETTSDWCLRSEESVKDKKDDTAKDPERFGFENNQHTYTEADGSVYIWDEVKSAWFPKVDDDFLAHYQMSYGFVDNKTEERKDEKIEEKNVPEDKALKRKAAEEPKWFDVGEEQNTKVYVSNLPLDITEEEFVDLMQKCGLIMRDPSTQKMKIKLYTKPNSQQLKGDALCTYIKIESVDLALKILDGYTVKNHRIKVQRAQFQMKGSYNPALKPKKKKKDKEKLKKMQEKLFDWRPEKMRGEKSKHEKVVIIKNLFEPSLFDAEVQLILEYQQDMREECGKCGEVKRVVLYDRHPDGVAQVTMKDPEEAENVVKLINGRWFGKRQLTAEIWDGKTKYKIEETDADINKRQDRWSSFLEDEEKKKRDALDEKQKVEDEANATLKQQNEVTDVEKVTEVKSVEVSDSST